MTRSLIRRPALAALVFTGWMCAAPALAQVSKAWQYHPGPYTIQGRVVTPDGHPAAGYPVKLLPAKPERGLDVDNTFYRISGRNVHQTVTDAQGRFAMTGVVDYPQVTTHSYRVVRAGEEERFPYNQDRQSDVVDLGRCTDPLGVLRIEIRLIAVAQVKIVLRDRQGRPFNGERAVSVAAEGERAYTFGCLITDGVGCILLPYYTNPVRGRIAVLRFSDARAALQEAAQHGERPGPGKPLTYGALGQQEILFIPGKTVTVEMTTD